MSTPEMLSSNLQFYRAEWTGGDIAFVPDPNGHWVRRADVRSAVPPTDTRDMWICQALPLIEAIADWERTNGTASTLTNDAERRGIAKLVERWSLTHNARGMVEAVKGSAVTKVDPLFCCEKYQNLVCNGACKEVSGNPSPVAVCNSAVESGSPDGAINASRCEGPADETSAALCEHGFERGACIIPSCEYR